MSFLNSRAIVLAGLLGVGALTPVLSEAATLSEAVQAGDAQAVRSLLQQHANTNALDADGSTPLHWATDGGNLEIVQMLLRAGARPDIANRNGITPLWIAADQGNERIARALLDAGANARETSPGGETILMTASRAGNSGVVALLLSHDADVNTSGKAFGETPLMLAAASNAADAVRALIAHGAQVDARSAEMHYEKDRFGLEGVQTILPHGNWTALMYGAREGSVDAVRVIVESGAGLNLTDPDGTSALLLAILNGHYDTAALLVEKGADPNLPDAAGMAALYAAVDMNTLGEVYGRPSRSSADKLNALGLMKVLLDHGADPNARLKSAALQRAHTPGEPTLGEGATPLMRAAKNGDVAAIELLIQRGADVSLAAKNGATALMFATGLGRGVGTFAKDYATDAQMLEAAKALVAHGADVNAISVAGQTPMHFAAQAADTNLPRPSDEMVQFLAAHGARVDVVDKQGRTPLEMAQGKGLRGRAGGPVTPRESTIELLRQLENSARQ